MSAYVKKTWKARQGTGLNKYRLQGLPGDPTVVLENIPDSITQEGDELNAEAMNDLETRIEEGFKTAGPVRYIRLTANNTSGTISDTDYATLMENKYNGIVFPWTNSDPGTKETILHLVEDTGTEFVYSSIASIGEYEDPDLYQCSVNKTTKAYTIQHKIIKGGIPMYVHNICLDCYVNYKLIKLSFCLISETDTQVTTIPEINQLMNSLSIPDYTKLTASGSVLYTQSGETIRGPIYAVQPYGYDLYEGIGILYQSGEQLIHKYTTCDDLKITDVIYQVGG